jgi:hypothetical protein
MRANTLEKGIQMQVCVTIAHVPTGDYLVFQLGQGKAWKHWEQLNNWLLKEIFSARTKPNEFC